MKTKLPFVNLSIVLLLFSCTSRDVEPANESEGEILNPSLGFQPNILWLVAEDQSPNIPSFGDSTIVTPTLDRLASVGISYDNFFSPHPVCAPARADIITGMYANHIGASHMRTGPWFSDVVPQEIVDQMAQYWPEGVKPYEAVPPPEVKMFTEYLRAAGYYCTNNAKQDYQFKKTMTAWDENSNTAHWRNRPEGKPFFSVFNFGVTHESQIWAKANDSLWVAEDLQVPVPPYLPDTEIGRKDIRRMYSNILEMDAQVGAILDQLEDDGLLDSTIVIWYTDHGGPLPRQKRLLHDSGIKVPMIIRFPGGEFASHRDERLISFIDLAPTTLSLAGIEPPSYMDGTAFLGKYMRETEPEYVFGAADRFDEVYDRNRFARNKQFKYIRYYMPEKPMFLNVSYRNQMPVMQELMRLRDAGELSEAQALWFRETKPAEELFDDLNDPHEINDLANDPAYADKLQELRQALDDWENSFNDTGLRDELELVNEFWPGQVQPITSAPEIVREGNRISITCDTEGASIGYKILSKDKDPTTMPWEVFTKPFEIAGDQSVVAIAHRIGYKRSNEVSRSK